MKCILPSLKHNMACPIAWSRLSLNYMSLENGSMEHRGPAVYRGHMGDSIVCFHFLSWSTNPFSAQKKKRVFLFNYVNFPPQAVGLSAALASASCSAEHLSAATRTRPTPQTSLQGGWRRFGVPPAPALTGFKLPPGPNEQKKVTSK